MLEVPKACLFLFISLQLRPHIFACQPLFGCLAACMADCMTDCMPACMPAPASSCPCFSNRHQNCHFVCRPIDFRLMHLSFWSSLRTPRHMPSILLSIFPTLPDHHLLCVSSVCYVCVCHLCVVCVIGVVCVVLSVCVYVN